MDDDEWDPNLEGVFVGRCDHCRRDSIPVWISIDPYLAEVREERSAESAWCLQCYCERKDEI
jgi:hypothetical protein